MTRLSLWAPKEREREKGISLKGFDFFEHVDGITRAQAAVAAAVWGQAGPKGLHLGIWNRNEGERATSL